MGRNKNIRKQIEGHRQVIEQHRRWIAAERKHPGDPKVNAQTIQGWLDDIARHERNIATLEAQLPQNRRSRHGAKLSRKR